MPSTRAPSSIVAAVIADGDGASTCAVALFTQIQQTSESPGVHLPCGPHPRRRGRREHVGDPQKPSVRMVQNFSDEEHTPVVKSTRASLDEAKRKGVLQSSYFVGTNDVHLQAGTVPHATQNFKFRNHSIVLLSLVFEYMKCW